MIEPEFIKHLNLVQSSPSFVIHIAENTGAGAVSNPTAIPDKSGEYLIHGTTTLKCGHELESVFHIDTATGGTLRAIYWMLTSGWTDSQDADAPSALSLDRSEVFPFDWTFSVPLERDIFHPAGN